jgi:hypothetical protein
MKTLLFSTLLALGAFTGCAQDSTGEHVNALSGEACEPDTDSYMAREAPAHCQGTSNGDNCDDLHSGKIDCIGDGNSGQGDDKKHNCEFPQPGCDEDGCCDEDIVEPPPPPPPPPPEDEDPPPDEPPPDEEPLPDVG